jgi:long-chain acyl-CoA synthetase
MNQNLGNFITDKKFLDKIAIVSVSDNQETAYTYRDIDYLSDAVARGLKKKNLCPGDRIAIFSDNRIEFICSFFGILKFGATAVLIGKSYPISNIKKILKDANCKLLFSDEDLDVSIPNINFFTNYKDFLDHGIFESYAIAEDREAFVMFSSGSTGSPKGISISHISHQWAVSKSVAFDKHFSEKRISLITAPMSHSNGLTTIEASLMGNGTAIILENFNARLALELIKKYKINTLYCVPSIIKLIIKEKNTKDDLLSIKQIRSASAKVTEKFIQEIRQNFPEAKIINNYGLSEVGPALFGPHPEGITRPELSVGYPIKNIEYRLVDNILEIKTPTSFGNYITGDVKNITEDGFFITNDLFEKDQEGFYYFLGRSDEIFKCGGYTINPYDIEKMLEQHEKVLSARVIPIEDDIKENKPYAFIIPKDNLPINETEITDYFLQNFPRYQLPRKIWILDQFPLTKTGKIDLKKLKEIANEFLKNLD